MLKAFDVPRPCPLCGREGGSELYRHRGRIVQCRFCGLVRRDPVPSAQDLLELYRSSDYFRLSAANGIGYGDYFADELIYRPYFRRKFELLSRFRRPPGTLLEIGAAAGYALDEARRSGWDVRGLEVSASAASYARTRFGLIVEEGGITDVPIDSTWDVIVAFQTIEHLPDVRGALRALARVLKPGGVLFLTTPDHGSFVRLAMRRFWPSYRPEHLVYFDRRRLRSLLATEGFRSLSIRSDRPLWVPLQRLVERAAHYYWAKRVYSRLIPQLRVPVWLGDMVVIAQRIREDSSHAGAIGRAARS